VCAGAVIAEIDTWAISYSDDKRHGDNAMLEVVARADELLADGDVDGARVWARITEVIGFLSTWD
jgi:hypothetical protein